MFRFGPAGASPLFYAQGSKSSTEVPAWLARLGLDAFEYQCGRGVNIKEETAKALGQEAARHQVRLSLHAPYYVNLAADGPTRENTKQHLLKSLEAAGWMGADRVVFHPGSGGSDRRAAMVRAEKLLTEILEEAEERGLKAVKLSPETTGKQNQLGSLEEVLSLCRLSPQVVPTLDFAHLYAREGGRPRSSEEFRRLLETVAGVLGAEALSDLHIHFSPIEYTSGGEKHHGNLLDQTLGPDFLALAEALLALKAAGTIICESADRQAEDALALKDMWRRLSEGGKELAKS